jgi:hypothetical protein
MAHSCAFVAGLVVAIVGTAGCGGGNDESATSPSGTPAAQGTAAQALLGRPLPGELAALVRRLARSGYAVEVIERRDLPTKALIVSPQRRRRENLPKTARPKVGLRVELPGKGVGYLYRFASHDLALAAGSSFLLWGVVDGVSGCGRDVYFQRKGNRNPQAADWSAEVGSFLHRTVPSCQEAFQVVI